MSEPMTDEDLAAIEGVLGGTDEPETDWWVQTVKRLVAEVRRRRALAQPLAWSKEPPRERGYYWYRPRPDSPKPYDLYDFKVEGGQVRVWDERDQEWYDAAKYGLRGGEFCAVPQPPE